MSTNELTILEEKANAMLELEEAAKELQREADEIKDFIKAEMTSHNETEVATKTHVIRFRQILTTKFDKARFIADMGEDSYAYYTKQTASFRFNVD